MQKTRAALPFKEGAPLWFVFIPPACQSPCAASTPAITETPFTMFSGVGVEKFMRKLPHGASSSTMNALPGTSASLRARAFPHKRGHVRSFGQRAPDEHAALGPRITDLRALFIQLFHHQRRLGRVNFAYLPDVRVHIRARQHGLAYTLRPHVGVHVAALLRHHKGGHQLFVADAVRKAHAGHKILEKLPA